MDALSSLNILLIEPDKLLATIYRQALVGTGHQVRVCATAQAAVSAADKQMPQLVILELQLVGHSGIEFLYEFRSYPEWRDIPVIIVSYVPPAEFSDSHGQLTHDLGVRTYCYKPETSLQKLLAAVSQCMPVAA